MDIEIKTARQHLKLALQVLEHRQERLKTHKPRLSLHYARVRHTDVLVELLQQVAGIAEQDPDMWDIDPEISPF